MAKSILMYLHRRDLDHRSLLEGADLWLLVGEAFPFPAPLTQTTVRLLNRYNCRSGVVGHTVAQSTGSSLLQNLTKYYC